MREILQRGFGWSLALLVALALGHGEQGKGAHAHGEGIFHRLAVADAREPLVRVLDEGGKELARFTVPAPDTRFYPLPGGQYVLMVHREADAVGFLFGGFRLEDHGDHQDLKREIPYVAATLRTGPKPTHVAMDERHLAVFHDGDGSVVLFDLRRLGVDFASRLVATGGADHGALVLFGDVLLVGGLERGQVEAYTLEGRRILTLPQACPRLHGQAVLGQVAAFGCADGVLLVERRGQGLQGRKVANPPRTPQESRVGTLVAHPQHPFFVGNFGQGLAWVYPKEGRLEPLPLPSRPMHFGFDPEGEALLVLTQDGRLHKLDPPSGRVLGSLEAISPWAQGNPRPGLAIGHGVVYLSDPLRGEVVKVDPKAWRVEARHGVGGAPSSLALFEVEGVEH
ncbi:MAG: hypothetical protein P3W93_007020 [Thermus sp.]|nr:hypothetical protein [Thermus sp.]